MAPEIFLDKMVHAIGLIKVPIVIIIFIIALIQLLSDAFIGGQDKRTSFATVLGLMTMAALIFYADKLVLWLSNFISR